MLAGQLILRGRVGDGCLGVEYVGVSDSDDFMPSHTNEIIA